MLSVSLFLACPMGRLEWAQKISVKLMMCS